MQQRWPLFKTEEFIWVPQAWCGHSLSHVHRSTGAADPRSNTERSFQPGNDLKPWNWPWRKEGWDWYLTQRLTRSIQECLILQVDWDTQWSRMSTADPAGLPEVVMAKSGVCECVCVCAWHWRVTLTEENVGQALGILIQLHESILLTLWFLCVCLHPQFNIYCTFIRAEYHEMRSWYFLKILTKFSQFPAKNTFWTFYCALLNENNLKA